MTATLPGSNAPPGGRRRAVSRFKPGIARAVIGEVVRGRADAGHLGRPPRVRPIAEDRRRPVRRSRVAIEIVLALATLVVPAYGARAIARSLRARRLAGDGRILDARTAAEDCRDDLLYVIGFGLVAAIVAFGAFFLAANNGRVRAVMFNWDLIWTSRTALLRGFWWNVKLFVVTEVIVLVWALVVAVVRQLPGRAFLPAAYARDRLRRRVPRHPDDHRDLPDRLRLPARRRRAVRDAHERQHAALLARRALARRSCTARTSPRCTAPGSRASTGARPRPRARSGCRSGRRCATS